MYKYTYRAENGTFSHTLPWVPNTVLLQRYLKPFLGSSAGSHQVRAVRHLLCRGCCLSFALPPATHPQRWALSQAMSSSTKTNPSNFLKTILGRPVVVKLNSGVDYRGDCANTLAAPRECVCVCWAHARKAESSVPSSSSQVSSHASMGT